MRDGPEGSQGGIGRSGPQDRAWSEKLEVSLAGIASSDAGEEMLCRAISALLKRAEVGHRMCWGSVFDEPTRRTLHPHIWIEIGEHLIVDFRLKDWFTGENIPSGVFDRNEWASIVYHSDGDTPVTALPLSHLDRMMNGMLSAIKIPDFDLQS